MPAGQALSEKESDIAAKAYMSANGVSLDTAKRRLEVESELPSVIAELKRRYSDRLAFVSIENMPDQHLVVGLKGNMMEAARHFSVSDSSIRVEFEEGIRTRRRSSPKPCIESFHLLSNSYLMQ